jgi:hypothetical protein
VQPGEGLDERLTETTGSELRKAGIGSYVRAGDGPGIFEWLKGRDVDGIITARPSLVRTRLGR